MTTPRYSKTVPSTQRELEEFYLDAFMRKGSSLEDIETRLHSMLQSVLGWSTGTDTVQERHISEADGKVWQDHVEIVDGNPHGTDHDQLEAIQVLDPTSADTVQDRHLSDAQGKKWEDHVDDDTRDDHSQYLLLEGRTDQTVTTPLILGDATDNTTFETDGTLKFNGDATIWEDMQFQISSGKVGVANNPTWEAFTANTSAYSFDVDDYIDLGANEPSHGWKEGSAGSVHIHMANKTAQSAGADRFAKFTVYLAFADINEAWTETSVTAEWTIPDGTVALNHRKLYMGDLALTNNLIGTQIKARVKRIAATGGTEYADNVFITQIGIHFEQDTVGSREVTTK